MNPLEALIALVAIGLPLSIPIFAIINRKGTPMGEAIAARMQKRHGTSSQNPQELEALKLQIEDQRQEISELRQELSFVTRMIEQKQQ